MFFTQQKYYLCIIMEYLLLTLGILCLIIGIAGCIIPMIPGTPIAYIGMLCFQFTDCIEFSTASLIIWGIVVILSIVLDYIVPSIGAKVFGGTKWGYWGCIIGTLLGMFILPWGIIAGPFLGAFIGELLGKKDSTTALKSGIGSLLGFLCGTFLKLVICIYFIIELIIALW